MKATAGKVRKFAGSCEMYGRSIGWRRKGELPGMEKEWSNGVGEYDGL